MKSKNNKNTIQISTTTKTPFTTKGISKTNSCPLNYKTVNLVNLLNTYDYIVSVLDRYYYAKEIVDKTNNIIDRTNKILERIKRY